MAEQDLATVNKLIKDEKKELRNFIEQKDEFYTKIRNNRQKDSARNILVKTD